MNRSTRPDPVDSALAAAQQRSPLFGRPGFLMRRLHQIHTGLFLEETAAFNITPVQYSLLTALADHGEMDQNTLALEIGLERTSAAEVLPRLEARGVLERRQWPEDRRVKLVRLTRRGHALVKRMAPAVQRAHDRTIEHLAPEERKQFMLQMIRLVEANNDTRAAPRRCVCADARPGGSVRAPRHATPDCGVCPTIVIARPLGTMPAPRRERSRCAPARPPRPRAVRDEGYATRSGACLSLGFS